jgi:hypothetical protein
MIIDRCVIATVSESQQIELAHRFLTRLEAFQKDSRTMRAIKMNDANCRREHESEVLRRPFLLRRLTTVLFFVRSTRVAIVEPQTSASPSAPHNAPCAAA